WTCVTRSSRSRRERRSVRAMHCVACKRGSMTPWGSACQKAGEALAQASRRRWRAEASARGGGARAGASPSGVWRGGDMCTTMRMSMGHWAPAEVYEAAGLTSIEVHVLTQRAAGRSLAEITVDSSAARPDGRPYTKQRLKQLEQAALAKLGVEGSIESVVHGQ